MASVSQLVEDVAEIFGETRETVNAYARALIDGGLLPKSSGRAIAQVEKVHILRLVCAVMLEPKIKDTVRDVSFYLGMTPAGVNGTFPRSLQETAEEFLLLILGTLLDGPDDESSEAVAARKAMLDWKITVVLNWREIEVADGSGQLVARFTSENGLFWPAHTKRQHVLSCQAFIMLGAKRGRDYCTWVP